MKITEDIVKALHACIADGYDSVADFASRVNVSANTISKYMRRETEVMQKDTWLKLQPLLTAYLPKDGDKVKKGDRICEWDPYNAVTLVETAGKAAFENMIEGVTFRKDNADEKARAELQAKYGTMREFRTALSAWNKQHNP